MAQLLSSKRLQINKASTTIVVVVSVASFVTVFSLIASKALLSQRNYQARVISEKRKALDQLRANNAAVSTLATSYQAFVSTPENVIGGSSTSTKGDRDGDNAKIILDALPSKYDFPALTASLEKILNAKSYKLTAITGTDDEVAQKANASSPNPTVVEIPFQVTVSTRYTGLSPMLGVLERSIRPFHIRTMTVSGTDDQLSVILDAKTYYQPEKNLTITTKDVQ